MWLQTGSDWGWGCRRALRWKSSTSILSSLGPLQLTCVSSPPQQALPAAMPRRLSVALNGAWPRIQLAMLGPYLRRREWGGVSRHTRR